MTVLILTKLDRNEYESNRLVENFRARDIEASRCYPDDFDVIVDRDIYKGLRVSIFERLNEKNIDNNRQLAGSNQWSCSHLQER
jgi:hypothetical protein